MSHSLNPPACATLHGACTRVSGTLGKGQGLQDQDDDCYEGPRPCHLDVQDEHRFREECYRSVIRSRFIDYLPWCFPGGLPGRVQQFEDSVQNRKVLYPNFELVGSEFFSDLSVPKGFVILLVRKVLTIKNHLVKAASRISVTAQRHRSQSISGRFRIIGNTTLLKWLEGQMTFWLLGGAIDENTIKTCWRDRRKFIFYWRAQYLGDPNGLPEMRRGRSARWHLLVPLKYPLGICAPRAYPLVNISEAVRARHWFCRPVSICFF